MMAGKKDRERIGFIGLGIMGRPMARNLLVAGYPVTVWNRSRPGMETLTKAGAEEGASPAAVARNCDIVITIVGDSPDVEQIALGEDGIIAGAHPGLIHIDMSTISPAVTRAIAAHLAEAGIDMLDAPVSGGEQGAIDGTLSVMVGGKGEIFERCRPVLDVLGGNLVYCGPSGAGQVVKLCNQVVVGLNNLALAEALVLAAKAGVPPGTMLEAVSAGAGASWVLRNLGPRILARDFQPGIKVAHQQKDLRLALELARESTAPLAGTALVHQLFAALEAEGWGEEGTQSLVKARAKLANTSVSG